MSSTDSLEELSLDGLQNLREQVGTGARAAMEQAQSIRARAGSLTRRGAMAAMARDASEQALARHRHLRFHADKPSGTLAQEPGYVQPSMTYALPFGGTANESDPEPSSAPSQRHSGSPTTATSAPSPDAARQGVNAHAVTERVYEMLAQELRTMRARTSGY